MRKTEKIKNLQITHLWVFHSPAYIYGNVESLG